MNWQTKSQDPNLSIGEISQRSGLSSRTIRYYEEVGLLPGVRRKTGGRRVYGADELERLRFIRRLKAFGLSLHEIKELEAVYSIHGSTKEMLNRLSILLKSHSEVLEGRMAELVDLRDEMSRYSEHVTRRIQLLSDEVREPGSTREGMEEA